MKRFSEGDAVHKPRGYKFPGVVVAEFLTLGGEVRYVVEMINFEDFRARESGLLHIFSGDQLAAGFNYEPPGLMPKTTT